MLLVVNTVYGSMPQTGAFKKRKVAVGRGNALALDLSRSLSKTRATKARVHDVIIHRCFVVKCLSEKRTHVCLCCFA